MSQPVTGFPEPPPPGCTIDELLAAICEYQNATLSAVQNRRWGQYPVARAALRSWIEEHQLPVSFPQEPGQ